VCVLSNFRPGGEAAVNLAVDGGPGVALCSTALYYLLFSR